MKKQTTQIRKDDFTKDYLSMLNSEVAKKYNISLPIVIKLAQELGISKSKGRKKIELI